MLYLLLFDSSICNRSASLEEWLESIVIRDHINYLFLFITYSYIANSILYQEKLVVKESSPQQ